MSLKNSVSLRVGRLALKSKSASPQILFAAGVIGVGATVVLACRATLRVEDVLDNHDLRIGQVDENDGKAKSRVYIHTGVELGKLYSPALICGVVSVGALAGSHNILVKRNAGLVAAYGALDKAFKGYRDRVREAYGEDRELELYQDAEVCEIERYSDGKKVKQAVASGKGPYSFFFCAQSTACYDRLPESNLVFLKQHQIYANQKLQARGHVFLNDVLDSLGMERTTAGAVTGWIRGEGDDFIDFGIFNRDMEERFVDFMRGDADGIWLDFNVDGTVYDRI